MWWPSPIWYEGSLTTATSDTAAGWALAGGEIGSGPGDDTYLLVANPNDTPANVTFALRQGSQAQNVCDRSVQLPPRSRFTMGIMEQCAQLTPTANAVYGTVRSNGPGIVVERSSYQSTANQFWAAGASTLLTRIP